MDADHQQAPDKNHTYGCGTVPESSTEGRVEPAHIFGGEFGDCANISRHNKSDTLPSNFTTVAASCIRKATQQPEITHQKGGQQDKSETGFALLSTMTTTAEMHGNNASTDTAVMWGSPTPVESGAALAPESTESVPTVIQITCESQISGSSAVHLSAETRRESSDNGCNFRIGELVWGKANGWGWLPATVCDMKDFAGDDATVADMQRAHENAISSLLRKKASVLPVAGDGDTSRPTLLLVVFLGDRKWCWLEPGRQMRTMSDIPEFDATYKEGRATARQKGYCARFKNCMNLASSILSARNSAEEPNMTAVADATNKFVKDTSSPPEKTPCSAVHRQQHVGINAANDGSSRVIEKWRDEELDNDPLTHVQSRRQEALELNCCEKKHGLTPAWVLTAVVRVFQLDVIGTAGFPPTTEPQHRSSKATHDSSVSSANQTTTSKAVPPKCRDPLPRSHHTVGGVTEAAHEPATLSLHDDVETDGGELLMHEVHCISNVDGSNTSGTKLDLSASCPDSHAPTDGSCDVRGDGLFGPDEGDHSPNMSETRGGCLSLKANLNRATERETKSPQAVVWKANSVGETTSTSALLMQSSREHAITQVSTAAVTDSRASQHTTLRSCTVTPEAAGIPSSISLCATPPPQRFPLGSAVGGTDDVQGACCDAQAAAVVPTSPARSLSAALGGDLPITNSHLIRTPPTPPPNKLAGLGAAYEKNGRVWWLPVPVASSTFPRAATDSAVLPHSNNAVPACTNTTTRGLVCSKAAPGREPLTLSECVGLSLIVAPSGAVTLNMHIYHRPQASDAVDSAKVSTDPQDIPTALSTYKPSSDGRPPFGFIHRRCGACMACLKPTAKKACLQPILREISGKSRRRNNATTSSALTAFQACGLKRKPASRDHFRCGECRACKVPTLRMACAMSTVDKMVATKEKGSADKHRCDTSEHAMGKPKRPEREWKRRPEDDLMVRGLLDPSSNCLARPNVPAEKLYTEAQDGLYMGNSWSGYHVYLNPPFDSALQWRFINRAIDEVESGRCPGAIILCRGSPDTNWWPRLRPYPRVLCRRKAVQFLDYHKTPIAFGVAIFCLCPQGPRQLEVYQRFFATLRHKGEVCIPIDQELMISRAFSALLWRLHKQASADEREHWLRCDSCCKWRRVPYAMWQEWGGSGAAAPMRWSCSEVDPRGCKSEWGKADSRWQYGRLETGVVDNSSAHDAQMKKTPRRGASGRGCNGSATGAAGVAIKRLRKNGPEDKAAKRAERDAKRRAARDEAHMAFLLDHIGRLEGWRLKEEAGRQGVHCIASYRSDDDLRSAVAEAVIQRNGGQTRNRDNPGQSMLAPGVKKSESEEKGEAEGEEIKPVGSVEMQALSFEPDEARHDMEE